MKRILVPTDGSEASRRALILATSISEKSNARVYVLHVIKTHGGAYFSKDGEIVEDHAHDVQKYRDQKAEESAKLKEWTSAINPDAHTVVKYGGIADVILETTRKYKVSLVIMGNKFSGTSEGMFFGDLASYLIRKSPVPILSFKSDLPENGLAHIVFANEFEGKLSYFDALQDLQMFCGAVIDFLYIKTNKNQDIAEIEANMDYFARINMIKNYRKHIHEFAQVESGILDWVSRNPCDLLAVKNVKRSGSPLFRPKLTRGILKNSNTSTMVYND